MRNITILFFLIITSGSTLAQTELKGTMGINFLSFPSLQDYINQTYAPSNSQLGTFNSAVIFTGEAGIFIAKDFELGLEIPYQIYSYTETVDFGQYQLTYNSLMPSIMAYYVLFGNGFNFKFGGGAGPRFINASENKKWQGTEQSFSSIGFGGLLRAEGNTALSKNVYANIGFDLRYDINGEPDNSSGDKLENKVKGENVNFNSLSLGVKLGISYLFGGDN
jgi:hypothetical protein